MRGTRGSRGFPRARLGAGIRRRRGAGVDSRRALRRAVARRGGVGRRGGARASGHALGRGHRVNDDGYAFRRGPALGHARGLVLDLLPGRFRGLGVVRRRRRRRVGIGRLGRLLVRVISLVAVSRASLPGVLGRRAPRHHARASRRRGGGEAAARGRFIGDRPLARARRRARDEIRANARRGPATREPAGGLAQGHDRSDPAHGGTRTRAQARARGGGRRARARHRPRGSTERGGRPARKIRTFSKPCQRNPPSRTSSADAANDARESTSLRAARSRPRASSRELSSFSASRAMTARRLRSTRKRVKRRRFDPGQGGRRAKSELFQVDFV